MKRTPLVIAFAFSGLFVMTLLTQVGGVLLLIGAGLGLVVFKRRRKRLCSISALAMYAIGLVVVPLVAKPFGREPLPWFASDRCPIQPRNIGYCLLFRNYVSGDLLQVLKDVSTRHVQRYPNESLDYLDACFPFFNGFPLLPHLSHDDGKKVDLCFGYTNKDGSWCQSPSPIGYWIYESPREDEYQPCGSSLLRWDFDFLQGMNRHRLFDQRRTRSIIQLLVDHDAVEKILVEPHLKIRMNISSNKVRFQGCRAARHDDHLHLQIY